jgi:hypothetical protein
MKWLTQLAVFAGPALALALLPAKAPAQEAVRVPVLQEWKGVVKTSGPRELAPRKLFIADQQTWNAVWTAWRPNDPVPKVDFGRELILVETSPGATSSLDVSWRMDVLGNLTATQTGILDDSFPGFVYVIQKVKLTDDMRSVYGIYLTDPFDRPCGE